MVYIRPSYNDRCFITCSTREELHEQRQRKYRALALRNQSKINTSVVKTSSRESRTTITPSASNPRKEMLDRLYPRICGRPAHETIVKKDSKKSAGAQTTGKGKQGSYSEEQREVVSWLKGNSFFCYLVLMFLHIN
jgi:hypothetical protein